MSAEPISDLLTTDWEPVYKELGYTKTIGLIKNGTSLNVAKAMVTAMKQNKKNLLTLLD